MLLAVLLLVSSLIGSCTCPSSYDIATIRKVDGTWEPASNGGLVDKDLAIIGSIDLVSEERQYVCRARYGDQMLPGKLDLSQRTCYIPYDGYEHANSTYEVLLNRDGYNLKWVSSSNGQFPRGSVIGGYSTGWPMFICRVKLRDVRGVQRYVSGKLDPEPKFESCYVPYDGSEKRFKEYQVLTNLM